MIPFKAPVFEEESFNCPHCNAYSHQTWESVKSYNGQSHPQYPNYSDVSNLMIAWCTHCSQYSLWLNDKMIYPEESGIQMPNPDLRDDIKDDYNEARSIVNRSPRGAVALLRLCVQKLCEQLGQPGKNINDDIKKLVEEGLPPDIQRALDIVRVIGNDTVHPGKMDLKDDVETANKLFELVNIIAQVMITQPKGIKQLYESLPEHKRKGIENRDKG